MDASSEIDRFKPIFKYYKSKIPSPKMDKVIDIRKGHEILEELQSLSKLCNHLYLKDSKDWKLFKLPNGIHIIANPFKNEGISYWTLRCLKDFSASRNNLKNETIWWNQVQTDSKVIDKLRWATLGFHHDWDTKVYTEQGKDREAFKTLFESLVQMTTFISQIFLKLVELQFKVPISAE